MKIEDIIKSYITEHHISVREFSRLSGLSNTYISNIINGADANPSLNAMQKIAKAMGINSQTLFDMLDGEQVFSIKKEGIKIPLYSFISCGTGLFIDDNIEDYIVVPNKYIRPGKEYYANTARGDSMVGKGIKDGDVLVFEKTNVLNNGEIGSFCIDENEAVCKVFRQLSNGIILLESANEKYSPIEVDVTDNQCFRIIGRYKFKFSLEQE